MSPLPILFPPHPFIFTLLLPTILFIFHPSFQAKLSFTTLTSFFIHTLFTLLLCILTEISLLFPRIISQPFPFFLFSFTLLAFLISFILPPCLFLFTLPSLTFPIPFLSLLVPSLSLPYSFHIPFVRLSFLYPFFLNLFNYTIPALPSSFLFHAFHLNILPMPPPSFYALCPPFNTILTSQEEASKRQELEWCKPCSGDRCGRFIRGIYPSLSAYVYLSQHVHRKN